MTSIIPGVKRTRTTVDDDEDKQVAVYKNDDDVNNDTNDDDDDEEDDIATRLFRRKKLKMKKKLDLPGGVAHCSKGLSSSSRYYNNSSNDDLPRSIAYAIHDYMDQVFGSIMWFRSESFTDMIPICVNAILSYNKIYFSGISITESPYSVEMFEPIWYYIDIKKKVLRLFYSRSMINEFASNKTDVPVYYTTGRLALDKFDPPYVHENVADCDIGTAAINCAVLCDHVSQHIITEILCPLPKTVSIHDPLWNKTGCTLHSIFDVTVIKDAAPEVQTSTTNVDLSRLVNGLNSVSTAYHQQQQHQVNTTFSF